jgi:hypothetical protein
MNYLLLAAAAAQVFNLNCTGESSGFQERKSFSLVYRVDLSRKKWCVGECRRLDDFVEIGPTHLTFEKKERITPWAVTYEIKTVDRETGKYVSEHIVDQNRGYQARKEWSGQCERLPFTGFPSFKTKF